jgi:hypothetical protein
VESRLKSNSTEITPKRSCERASGRQIRNDNHPDVRKLFTEIKPEEKPIWKDKGGEPSIANLTGKADSSQSQVSNTNP